jgi:hypothetical protein
VSFVLLGCRCTVPITGAIQYVLVTRPNGTRERDREIEVKFGRKKGNEKRKKFLEPFLIYPHTCETVKKKGVKKDKHNLKVANELETLASINPNPWCKPQN